ncbi:APC family permease [Frankia sp. Cpl3]|uniref:APC family permease n=1 Tax=Parafrankia colletiae TaxID=573497 RepID=UPI000A070F56|nr:APC family permease [Parafrankia colletiae]MCK9902331.1 APC family permease [Frankia sp. Cpl3]
MTDTTGAHSGGARPPVLPGPPGPPGPPGSPGDPTAGDDRLRRTLTTPKIAFLIVSAAAPLGALVGTVPLAFALGSGPGVPATFVLAGLTLLCFSVGYAAISRRVVNAGGFYTYVAQGLGRVPAVGGGWIALLAYNAATIGVTGAFAYFAQLVAASHGLDLRWELWAAAGIAVTAALGYRQIDISARVVAVLLVAEVGILIALDVAILARDGTAALPATAFAPDTVFGPGLGVSLMFAFVSYIGFESAALYGEEARDPERSVPRATYLAVVAISVFYALTSWLVVGAVGAGNVRASATEQLGDLFFQLSDDYLVSAATTVMQVLLCTSLLAGMLALHGAAVRYLFVLGRERLLPTGLGAVHPRHGAPHRASLVQSGLTVVVVAAFAVAGLDPYVSLATSMLGLGTVAIIVLQALAGVAVLGYCWRHPAERRPGVVVASLAGVAGLTAAAVLVVGNFSVMTGTTNAAITSLPWLVLVAAVGGTAHAWWLRRARPQRFAALARQPATDHPASDDGPADQSTVSPVSAASV